MDKYRIIIPKDCMSRLLLQSIINQLPVGHEIISANQMKLEEEE